MSIRMARGCAYWLAVLGALVARWALRDYRKSPPIRRCRAGIKVVPVLFVLIIRGTGPRMDLVVDRADALGTHSAVPVRRVSSVARPCTAHIGFLAALAHHKLTN